MKPSREHESTPHIRVMDADDLAANTHPAFLVIDITLADIQSSNIASVLERLHVMTDSKENTLRYRESMTFLVDGYNADHRELYEIPQVRAFFHKLVAHWPHWIWFLTRGTGSFALLLSLLCKVCVVRNEKNGVGTEFMDTNELNQVLNDMIERGTALFDAYELPEQLVNESVASAFRELSL